MRRHFSLRPLKELPSIKGLKAVRKSFFGFTNGLVNAFKREPTLHLNELFSVIKDAVVAFKIQAVLDKQYEKWPVKK